MGTLMLTKRGLRMSRLTLMSMEDWVFGMTLIGGDFVLTAYGDRAKEYQSEHVSFNLKVGIPREIISLLRNKLRPKLIECLRDPLQFAASNLEKRLGHIAHSTPAEEHLESFSPGVRQAVHQQSDRDGDEDHRVIASDDNASSGAVRLDVAIDAVHRGPDVNTIDSKGCCERSSEHS